MSKFENGGLDQYGAELFEQQQFGPAGVEGVNNGFERNQAQLVASDIHRHKQTASYDIISMTPN